MIHRLLMGYVLLERAVGKNEKLESYKLETERNWKEPSEIGNNQAKLERTDRSWKVNFEVGIIRCSWKD